MARDARSRRPDARGHPSGAPGSWRAAAIALALELNAERLVVDDLDARRACGRLGVPVVGTLGVLVAAKKRGQIESVRAALERLEASNFRVRPTLRALVLAEAGEAG